MQNTFSKFLTLFNCKEIKTSNKYLQVILSKFHFYYSNPENEKDIFELSNESKIIIIDEYYEDDTKYFFVCFDYNLIIFNIKQGLELGNSLFNNFISNQADSEKYFFKQNKYEGANIIDKTFLKEINNFSLKFTINKPIVLSFWKLIVNCLSGFLIKKAYKDSFIKPEKKISQKYLENEEKLALNNDSYIRLREIGRGSSAAVDLIYYITGENLFALKIPHEDMYEQIERERTNLNMFQSPFIVHYFGYIENKRNKCLLLEYVEGETMDDYDLDKLNEKEKYNIIFELLITFQYMHSYGYIYRDLYFKNVIINKK